MSAALRSAVFVLCLTVATALVSSWTGAKGDSRGVWLIIEMARSVPLVACWMLAAVGFGAPIRHWLRPEATPSWLESATIGIAVMLVLDALLGRLGVLQLGERMGAIALIGTGLALLALEFIARRRTNDLGFRVPPITLLVVIPTLAVILVAASAAPGWLWGSEFGGYDALSYHLQLPQEWMDRGSITGLTHNVYSFFPGYMEAAFYHLAVLRGDILGAATACQLLHAVIGILAAITIGRLADDWFGAPAGLVAFPIALGTPWLVVTGTLAYNDMTVVLFLATGLRIATGARPSAVLLGLLLGAACGAKLTAIGTVVVPIGLIVLLRTPRQTWIRMIGASSITCTITLAPWLIGNTLATGNPVFPMATSLLGSGHWDKDTAATWSHGHGSTLSTAARFTESWNQFGRYGLGPTPYQGEPWKPQWSILPLLGLVCLLIGLAGRTARSTWTTLIMIIVLQALFWIVLTHVKSRFMLPAVVPLAVAIGGVAAMIASRVRSRALFEVITAVALFAWCVVPALLFKTERNGAPAYMTGFVDARVGRSLSASHIAELAPQWPDLYVRTLLPGTARVLLVGDAAPLYYPGNIAYQTTWDRGPLSVAMRAHPDDESRWFAALIDEGFTHLLVHREMLDRWEADRWNDPLITAERVLSAADRHATLLHTFGTGPNAPRIYGL